MDKKCYKFTERNSWESETWNFYIDMTEEQRQALSMLITEKPEYRLSEKEYTADEVNTLTDNARDGYMASDKYLGKLVKLPASVDWVDDDVFYKGGIEDFCTKEDK